MNLLIDAGNSTIALAIENDHQLTQTNHYQYVKSDIARVINDMNNAYSNEVFENIFVSNVAGENMKNALIAWSKKTFNKNPTFAATATEANKLTNSYTEPTSLGVDRWLAMIAAKQHCTGSFCVADCGTALTVDTVNEKGIFIGGLILPGLSLMRESLNLHTDAINIESDRDVNALYAKNTQDAVIGGSIQASAALIDKVMDKLQSTSSNPVSCFVTGGNANVILGALTQPATHAPNLVLEGLAITYLQSNVGSSH